MFIVCNFGIKVSVSWRLFTCFYFIRFAEEDNQESKDTEPLLRSSNESPLANRRDDKVNQQLSKKGKPMILDLDRVMASSMYSDKMQV